VLVNDVLGRDALLHGAHGDGGTVLVAPAHEQYLLAPLAQVAHVDIGRQVGTGDVADVQRTVGVWQGSGDGVADGLFHGSCDCKRGRRYPLHVWRSVWTGPRTCRTLVTPGRRPPARSQSTIS